MSIIANNNREEPPLNDGELGITLQFGGGAELLFDNIKSRNITLPSLRKCYPDCCTEDWRIQELLTWLRENLLRDREELFLQGSTVRPGILVLINDTDWELLGELEYVIKPGDTILFISTLHGG